MGYLLKIGFALVAGTLYGQQFIPIWEHNRMPNTRGLELEYQEKDQRITQVSSPGIYAFFPSQDENNGSAVLICPSGGYQKLTYDLGGFQLAKWFNTLGMNAFVLIYRLPNSPDLIEREKGPIQDAQRAMKIIKAHAYKWGIDTTRVGIMGSSAGGHLASILGTHTDDFSLTGDTMDRYSFKPGFMILVSPVISMDKYTHIGSRNNLLGESPSIEMITLYSNELHVNGDMPPTFVVHAQNDQTVSPMNSILFFQAITAEGAKGCLHIFPQGDHSIGLRNNPGSTDEWTVLCEKWLSEMYITH